METEKEKHEMLNQINCALIEKYGRPGLSVEHVIDLANRSTEEEKKKKDLAFLAAQNQKVIHEMRMIHVNMMLRNTAFLDWRFAPAIIYSTIAICGIGLAVTICRFIAANTQ